MYVSRGNLNPRASFDVCQASLPLFVSRFAFKPSEGLPPSVVLLYWHSFFQVAVSQQKVAASDISQRFESQPYLPLVTAIHLSSFMPGISIPVAPRDAARLPRSMSVSPKLANLRIHKYFAVCWPQICSC